MSLFVGGEEEEEKKGNDTVGFNQTYEYTSIYTSGRYFIKLDLIEQLKRIIPTCAVICVLSKKQGLARFSVKLPDKLSHVEFLDTHFPIFRCKKNQRDFTKYGIFWRQAIKWCGPGRPSVEHLREGNPVFRSIIQTFQEDIGVSDELTIMYWKTRFEEVTNQGSTIRTLRSKIDKLKAEVNRLEELHFGYRKNATKQLNDHEVELTMLRKAYTRIRS
jgi:hypothetical protein